MIDRILDWIQWNGEAYFPGVIFSIIGVFMLILSVFLPVVFVKECRKMDDLHELTLFVKSTTNFPVMVVRVQEATGHATTNCSSNVTESSVYRRTTVSPFFDSTSRLSSVRRSISQASTISDRKIGKQPRDVRTDTTDTHTCLCSTNRAWIQE